MFKEGLFGGFARGFRLNCDVKECSSSDINEPVISGTWPFLVTPMKQSFHKGHHCPFPLCLMGNSTWVVPE